MLPEICLGFVMLGIVAYAVFGGADFGAGFWDLTAGGAHKGGRVRGLIQRSMSPVWEANHVWIIFILVFVWTAFPVAFGSIFSTLMLPIFVAGMGIIFRGAAFVFRGQAATINEARTFGAIFALSSVAIPFFLGATIGGVASGRVPVGNAAGDMITSWLNPTGIALGVLAVLMGAYVSAVYLAGDAERAELPDLVEAFRKRALITGAIAGPAALGTLVVVYGDARPLFDGLTSGGGLACVLFSAAAGVGTLALVWTRRFTLARVSSAAAVTAVIVGWVLAQNPYFLPGELTLEEAAASDATLWAMVVATVAGFVILVPSLYYLYSLVLKGTLDQDFEPLDQRFGPAPAMDEPRKTGG